MQVLQKNPLDRVAAARVYQQVEQGIRRLREEQQAAAKADREVFFVFWFCFCALSCC